MTITLRSSSFHEGDMIPMRHTCDGEDRSPLLEWEPVPANTKSLAILCDDPDAPRGTWFHWIVYNIPPDCTSLPEGATMKAGLPPGTALGMNDFQKLDYGGPCPPGGTHRYNFSVYALDHVLPQENYTGAKILQAMKGHVLDQGRLMGRYKRK